MNILMLHPHDVRYDPWTIRIVELARHLQLRGNNITLGYIPKRRIEPHERPVHGAMPDGVQVHQLGFRHSHLWKNTRSLQQLARDADIVHIQKCFPSVAIPALWAAYLADRPIHYDWDDHESALAEIVESRTLYRHQISVCERSLPSLVDTITYSSEGIRRMAISRGFPDERMRWAPVGANLDRFTPGLDGTEIRERHGVDSETPLVLYVGQLEGAAYAELVVRSMEYVQPKFPNAVLWIVGGGKGLDSLKEFCKNHSTGENVRLIDYVSHDEVPLYLAAADVCVASFEENAATVCKSPLKIAEYLAAGKAIVASAVGEVQRMLDSCGILVRPGEPEGLAIGICGFLGDIEFRRKYEKLARKKAEQVFHWGRTAEKLEEAYSSAISLHAPGDEEKDRR